MIQIVILLVIESSCSSLNLKKEIQDFKKNMYSLLMFIYDNVQVLIWQFAKDARDFLSSIKKIIVTPIVQVSLRIVQKTES